MKRGSFYIPHYEIKDIDAFNSNNPLTCKDVAKILTDCANKRCDYCKFKGEEECKNLMVQEMGKAVEYIAERMGDDGK